MQVTIKVWREGKNIVVRNDRFHINTFGKNLEEALENFHDAFRLAIEDNKGLKGQKHEVDLILQMNFPIGRHTGQLEVVE